MMTRLSQHGGWNCELENRAKEILLGRYITNFAEEFEFAAKGSKGKPCGESYISASYNCTLEAGERARMIEELGVKGELKKRVEALNDVQLSRVVAAKRANLSAESGIRISSAIDTLAGTEARGRKIGGDNLQDPANAAKYVEFYERGGDKTHKPKYDTSKEELEFAVKRMQDEKIWTNSKKALNAKGSPEASMRQEAWGDQPADARAKAVLKSLMDNEFKDVLGNELPWNSGMQLDHKLAGSMGGKDTPDNWVWISAPTNQVKGSIELEIKAKKLTGEAADKFLSEKLIATLNNNASMSESEVAKIKNQGSAAAAAKAEFRAALRQNLPLKPLSQIEKQINGAKTPELKSLMQASTYGEKPAALLKKSIRGQTDYPSVPQMKAFLRMRWGFELGRNDLQKIAEAIVSSKFDKRSPSKILEVIEERFGPPRGLSTEQRNTILGLVGKS
jgi:hypothetical protein